MGGNPVNLNDPQGLAARAVGNAATQTVSYFNNNRDSAASLGADLLPVVGSLKSGAQVITGRDLMTGESVNRGMEAAGILLGLVPGGKALSKADDIINAAKVATNYKMFECKQCADALVDSFTKAGINGKRIDISTQSANGAGGNIWHDGLGKNISTNGEHSAVEVNGKVYDNIHKDGVSRSDWESQLHSIFGDFSSFNVKETKF